MYVPTCDCSPSQFVAYLYPVSDDYRIDVMLGILVEPDGTVTNIFNDGIVGASLEQQEQAKEQAESEGILYCPLCGAPAEWR